MPDLETASDILRAALADLPPSKYVADRPALDGLHQKRCDVASELKAIGMAPEHVILTVKGIAFEAMMGPLASLVVEKMVKWCLDEYFKDAA